MDDKWAKETASKIVIAWFGYDDITALDYLTNILLEAERRGFERGVEDSAKKFENFESSIHGKDIAYMIRKLKQTEAV